MKKYENKILYLNINTTKHYAIILFLILSFTLMINKVNALAFINNKLLQKIINPNYLIDSYPGQPGSNYPYPPTTIPSNPPSPPYPNYPSPIPSDPNYHDYYSPESLYRAGINAFNRGDYYTALKHFEAIVSRYPYYIKAPDSCFLAAESAKAIQQFTKAIYFYRKVVNDYSYFSRVDEAYYFIGYCLIKLSDYYNAINEFRNFISIYHTSHLIDNAWFVLGRTYEQVRDFRNAIYCYQVVVNYYPLSDVFHQAYERFKYLQGFIEDNGGNSNIYPPQNQPPTTITLSDRDLYNRAHTMLIRGNYKAAIIYFDELLKRYPNSELADDATLWKGKTYLEVKEFQNAAQVLEYFIIYYSYSELYSEAIFTLAWSYYQLGLQNAINRNYFNKAATRFSEFYYKFPMHSWAADAMFYEGECYERLGNVSLALACYKQVINKYPNSASAFRAKEKLSNYR